MGVRRKMTAELWSDVPALMHVVITTNLLSSKRDESRDLMNSSKSFIPMLLLLNSIVEYSPKNMNFLATEADSSKSESVLRRIFVIHV